MGDTPDRGTGFGNNAATKGDIKMRIVDKRLKVSRRGVLGAGAASAVALSILPEGLIVGAGNAWAATASHLKTETFATLVQMCRDIYPHDRVVDKHYAKVVEGFDAAAGKSDDDKVLFENGVIGLDEAAKGAHGVLYVDVGWESRRVALLRGMEKSAFFQKVRGTLVVGIYNNQALWPLFGYEGESASKGGYINRGFDDIDWLDQV